MTSPKNTPQKIQPVHTTSPVRPLLASALLIAGLAVGALSGMRGQPVTANPSPAVQIHSIDGKLMQPAAGGPLEGIVVTIVETGATTTVDSHGNFVFGSVGSGIYTLTAAGKGYASLKITDVVVTAGKTLTLPNEEMPVAAPGGVQTVSAISESELGIQTLASYYVVASAAKAFEGGRNMDIPRTSNDIQPYTIINQEAIEESNRLNLGDFLRDNLTQNATGLQYNQTPSLYTVAASGSSQVNLQGLGNLQTLILINGARVAAQVFKGVEFQPNINQI